MAAEPLFEDENGLRTKLFCKAGFQSHSSLTCGDKIMNFENLSCECLKKPILRTEVKSTEMLSSGSNAETPSKIVRMIDFHQRCFLEIPCFHLFCSVSAGMFRSNVDQMDQHDENRHEATEMH